VKKARPRFKNPLTREKGLEELHQLKGGGRAYTTTKKATTTIKRESKDDCVHPGKEKKQISGLGFAARKKKENFGWQQTGGGCEKNNRGTNTTRRNVHTVKTKIPSEKTKKGRVKKILQNP